MTGRSARVAVLLYSGLACAIVGIFLYIFFDADGSPYVLFVCGMAGVGFPVLTGAALLQAYGEHDAAPVWAWLVFSVLSLISIIIPPFGRFEQGGGWIRLAPLYLAVALYCYKRLFAEKNRAT